MKVPPDGWFIHVYFMENLLKMDDDWGYPHFMDMMGCLTRKKDHDDDDYYYYQEKYVSK